MFSKDDEYTYHMIVARSWVDDAFRKQFIKDPRKVFADHGIQVPDKVDLAVKEGATRGKYEIALPPKPDVPDDHIRKLILDQPDPCY